MVDKENPSSQTARRSQSPVEAIYLPDSSAGAKAPDHADTSSESVTAILVDEPPRAQEAFHLGHLSARGGAVASTVLGAWSIFGAWITAYSVINAFLGLALGCWGLASDVRWPWLGPVLSLVGIAACLIAAAGG
jgi:hypothetical protein